jgi:hypothetical protein
MIGKKFPSDDQVLGRLRKLQRLVKSIQKAPTVSIPTTIIEEVNDDKIDVVENYTEDYVLGEEDFGKTMIMNAAGAKTFTFPSVTVSEIGRWVEFVKKGAGKLTIQAVGTDTINDSGAGGTVYNDLAEETFALVRLKVIAAGQWLIEFFTGSGWRTS